MKLHILSDLHVDVDSYDFVHVPDARFVIIAGDVGEKLTKKSLVWLAAEVKRRGAEIVYVPGNHDFYKTNVPSELERARAAAAELGIHLLATGESVLLQGVKIVGATLWTDYNLSGNRALAMVDAGDRNLGLNDHRYIRHNGRFHPRTAASLHYQQRMAIRTALEEPFEGPTVVVTHHAPHPRSLKVPSDNPHLDAAYASDLGEMIAELRPTLWIHGHVHTSQDYMIADTRVVSNPRGYFTWKAGDGEVRKVPENPAFDPEFTVTI